MRSNPLLRFLREKGERKMAEKRAARDKARGLVATSLGGGGSAKALKVTGVLSKSGVSRTKVSAASLGVCFNVWLMCAYVETVVRVSGSG